MDDEDKKLFGLNEWGDVFRKYPDRASQHYLAGWRVAGQGWKPSVTGSPQYMMGYEDRIGRYKDD